MSSLPVATAFGTHDVVEMQPLPLPGSLTKYSSDEPAEHTVGEGVNAIWIILPPSAAGRYLTLYGGPAVEVEANHSIPVAQQTTPYAVPPGATFTLFGDGGAAFDYWIQEVAF